MTRGGGYGRGSGGRSRRYGSPRHRAGQIEAGSGFGVREAWDRLLDFAIAAWLGVLDRLAPLPETEVDRAIRATKGVPMARRAPAAPRR
jgi:hypothetical protein